MNRSLHKKIKIIMVYILAALMVAGIFSSCSLKEEINEGGNITENTQPAEKGITVETQEHAAISAAPDAITDIGEIWKVYSAGIEKMSGLSSIEQNQLLYTKRESGDESINLRLRITSRNSDDITVCASGNVKTGDSIIPMEIYYYKGIKYVLSNGVEKKAETELGEVLEQVDFLKKFHEDLSSSYITAAAMDETADGIKTISMEFRGYINNLYTEGKGEVVINRDGLVSSEGYSFTADAGADGEKVAQSVECVLVGAETSVEEISLPTGMIGE